jgi:hypothetical protein
VLAFFRKLPLTGRTVAARVGRRFAAFAHVPYEEPHARRELVHLMDDLDIGHDSQSLAIGNKAQQFRWRRFAYVPRAIKDGPNQKVPKWCAAQRGRGWL